MTDQAERRRTGSLDVTLARLEAKVDVALAQHGAKIEQHGSELGELRQRVARIEDRPIASVDGLLDHEHRIRKVEQAEVAPAQHEHRDAVTVRQMLASLAGAAAVVAAAVPFLDRLYGA